jgi:hypothetical protein
VPAQISAGGGTYDVRRALPADVPAIRFYARLGFTASHDGFKLRVDRADRPPTG